MDLFLSYNFASFLLLLLIPFENFEDSSLDTINFCVCVCVCVDKKYFLYLLSFLFNIFLVSLQITV